MKHYSGAALAIPSCPSSIEADLLRIHAMGMAWDEAANALSRRDIPAFDQAMSKFREASKEGDKQ